MVFDMDLSRRDRATLRTVLVLGLSGAAAGIAGTHGLWLAAAGAVLLTCWQAGTILAVVRHPQAAVPSAGARRECETFVDRLLLDAAPTPLVLVEDGIVRALNRSARTLFATDDRVLPGPQPLFDRAVTHLRYAARSWRMDRVAIGPNDVVALIDVESEERVAEARASADMIRVLGHEMLNGLVPIVSLAECGIAAVERDPALLPEILTTLARQAEGLQRFTEAYRTLARLPPPLRQPTGIAELLGDLARLFASRWPQSRLMVTVEPDLTANIDRDQISQALWAMLQNAVEAARLAEPANVTIVATIEGNMLTIDVIDDGTGIPVDRSNIFRPFQTTKSDGTGIGLSVARNIMMGHGGWVTLMPVMPTTFRCLLPTDR